MPTTTVFECDCCDCEFYIRLKDCCTDTATDWVVCSGATGTGIVIDGACYSYMEGTYTKPEVLLNGWTIKPITVAQLYGGSPCEEPSCKEWYQVAYKFCASDCVVDYKLFGPGTYEQYTDWLVDDAAGRDWIYIEGEEWLVDSVLERTKCDDASWGDYAAEDVIHAWQEDLVEKDNDACCNHHLVSGVEGDDECCLIPCCIQISGMTFTDTGTCGTYAGSDPEWDGKLQATYDGDGSYSAAQSFDFGDPDGCHGNWDLSNGRLPGGTDAALYGLHIVWWDATYNIWRLDLTLGIYYWTGDGGTDCSDPTGTYTFVSRGGGGPTVPACGGPTTLTVSAIAA